MVATLIKHWLRGNQSNSLSWMGYQDMKGLNAYVHTRTLKSAVAKRVYSG